MRECQQKPEEDRQPRAPQVVVEIEPYRLLRRLACLCRKSRLAVRITPGEQEEVARRLRPVPEAEEGKVAQAVWHPAGGERGEPAEERDDRECATRLVRERFGTLSASRAAATTTPQRRAQQRSEHESRDGEDQA